MPYAIYSVAAAGPSLALALRKIAHTPTARLRVGYRVVPRHDCYVHECARQYIRGLRPLGNGLLLDRIVAGGIVGEQLPISNLRISLEQFGPMGQVIDDWA